MKRRVSEMEEEARKLIELQSQVELGSSSGSIGQNKEETDARSVYVGNVCNTSTYTTIHDIHFIHSIITFISQKPLLTNDGRLIMVQHQRSSRPTSNHAAPSTE